MYEKSRRKLKNMVLLVYPGPDRIKSYRFGYSLLLLYIASDLRSHGFAVKLWDFSVEKYPDSSFKRDLESVSAVVMEIDAFPLKRSTNLLNARTIAYDIRTVSSKIPIIGVGKQCTLFNHSLDFVNTTIAGDSETKVSFVLDLICRGLPYKNFYDVGENLDLSQLPFPAYDLLSNDQIHGKTSSGHMHLAASALLETSRGCPGRCTFCQRKGWCEKISLFPLNVIQENFQSLIDFGIKNIWITDENFAGNIEHAKQTLKIFKDVAAGRHVRISMSSWVHVSEDFLCLAKDAGVSIISFGLESITKENQDFYNKHYDKEKVKKMIEVADSLGIYTVGNFIIGSPYDSHDTVEENLQFAVNSKLDVVNIKTLDYMMGSELYDGLPKEIQTEIHFFACREKGVAQLSAAEIKQLCDKFMRSFQLSRKGVIEKKIALYGPPYIGC